MKPVPFSTSPPSSYRWFNATRRILTETTTSVPPLPTDLEIASQVKDPDVPVTTPNSAFAVVNVSKIETDPWMPQFNSSDGLVVTELTPDTSFTLNKDLPLCIPSSFRPLRFRLRYGDLFHALHDQVKVIQDAIGKFYSFADENPVVARFRHCKPADKSRNNGLCPISAVQPLDSEAAKLRLDIIHELVTVKSNVQRVITAWASLPNHFQSDEKTHFTPSVSDMEWPLANTSDSRDVVDSLNTASIYYPKLDPNIVSSVNALSSIPLSREGAILVTNETASSVFLPLYSNLRMLSLQLDQIAETTHGLSQGYFPDLFFPFEAWVEPWLFVTDSREETEATKQQQKQIIAILQSLPLTHAKLSTSCAPLAYLGSIDKDCTLDAIAMLPKPDSIQNVIPYGIRTFPFQYDSEWYRLTLNHDLVYRLDDKIYTVDSKEDVRCFEGPPVSGCRFCDSLEAFKEVHDPCVKNLLEKGTLADKCWYTPLPPEQAKDELQVIPHGEFNEIVVSKDQPSSIIEACDLQKRPTIIPSAARILIKAACKFLKLINAPFIKEFSPVIELINVPVPINQLLPQTRNTDSTIDRIKDLGTDIVQQAKDELHRTKMELANEANKLKEHVEDNWYAYLFAFLIFASIFILCTIAGVIWGLVKKCLRRRKKTHNKHFENTPNHSIMKRQSDSTLHDQTHELEENLIGPSIRAQPVIHQMPAT